MCRPDPFPPQNTVALEKVKRRRVKKVGDTTLILNEQRQNRLGICGLEGGEAEGRCGRSKIRLVWKS